MAMRANHEPQDARIRSLAMKQKILTREEEDALARAWKEDRDLEARNKLIIAHQRLLVTMAKRFMRYGFSFRDLMQQGNMGLMAASDKFDPSKGNRFATYAQWWAFTSMQEFVTRNISPVRIGRSRPEREALRGIMSGKTDEETADGDKVSVDMVQRLRSVLANRSVSLNATIGGDENGASFMDLVEDENFTPDTMMEGPLSKTRHKVLASVIDDLEEREAIILRERYLSNDRKTLKTISAEMGISAERVRQIEQTALAKLRRRIESAGFRSQDLFVDD